MSTDDNQNGDASKKNDVSMADRIKFIFVGNDGKEFRGIAGVKNFITQLQPHEKLSVEKIKEKIKETNTNETEELSETDALYELIFTDHLMPAGFAGVGGGNGMPQKSDEKKIREDILGNDRKCQEFVDLSNKIIKVSDNTELFSCCYALVSKFETMEHFTYQIFLRYISFLRSDKFCAIGKQEKMLNAYSFLENSTKEIKEIKRTLESELAEIIKPEDKKGMNATPKTRKLLHDLFLNMKLREKIDELHPEGKDTFANFVSAWQINELAADVAELAKKKNVIFYGAPGTGKTFHAVQMAELLTHTGYDPEKNPQIKKIQFHPSYDYTDFIGGYRPNESGTFTYTPGCFSEFCAEAAAHSGNPYVFIIDEINRGDISKIFGEAFSAIEDGYRGESVDTQYGKKLSVPKDVYIIGTMNTIDRSVESIDFAIRRRFDWINITADDSANSIPIEKEARDRMARLNKAIVSIGLTEDYQIGASYFLNVSDYDDLWTSNLKPLLVEYLRGMPDAAENLEKLEDAYEGNKDK